MTQTTAVTHPPPAWRTLVVPGVVLVGLLWSYWPTLAELVEFWATNDDYSVGQLVPLVAAYLIWRERVHLAPERLRPSWAGLGLVLFSQAMRFGGLYYDRASVERLSIVIAVAGLVLLIGGWLVTQRLKWVLVFLLLMVPLPGRVHDAIAMPLQDWATALGLFSLELFGFLVVREGNVLRLGEHATVMVAEACSGLRMLTAFVFTSAVLCFLVRRPAWQKLTILASSIPVAVLANGIRVFVTSVFIYYARDPSLEQKFHDFAGLLMMPLAVAILLGELAFLKALTTPAASGQTTGRPPTGKMRPAVASGGKA